MCEMRRWSMWSLRVPWGWGNHLQRESQRNVGNFQARASVRSHSPRLHDSNAFQSCIKLQIEAITWIENWKMCLLGYEQCIIDTILVVPSVLSANREVWKVEELRMESHRIAGWLMQGFRRFSAESTDLDKGHCFQCRLVQSSDH